MLRYLARTALVTACYFVLLAVVVTVSSVVALALDPAVNADLLAAGFLIFGAIAVLVYGVLDNLAEGRRK